MADDQDSAYPRQLKVTLESALATAISTLRAQAAEYRNPHGGLARRIDKAVRKNIAATFDDNARVIEAHLAEIERLNAPTRAGV